MVQRLRQSPGQGTKRGRRFPLFRRRSRQSSVVCASPSGVLASVESMQTANKKIETKHRDAEERETRPTERRDTIDATKPTNSVVCDVKPNKSAGSDLSRINTRTPETRKPPLHPFSKNNSSSPSMRSELLESRTPLSSVRQGINIRETDCRMPPPNAMNRFKDLKKEEVMTREPYSIALAGNSYDTVELERVATSQVAEIHPTFEPIVRPTKNGGKDAIESERVLIMHEKRMSLVPRVQVSSQYSGYHDERTCDQKKPNMVTITIETAKNSLHPLKFPSTAKHAPSQRGRTCRDTIQRQLAQRPSDIISMDGNESIDTASRMMAEQTLSEKVIDDISGAFGFGGAFTIQFNKRQENSEVDLNEKTQEKSDPLDLSASVSRESLQLHYNRSLSSKIDSMNSDLTEASASSSSSTTSDDNTSNYISHIWSGGSVFTFGQSKARSQQIRATASPSSASSRKSSKSQLTGRDVSLVSSNHSTASHGSTSTRESVEVSVTDSLCYSNTEYSLPNSDHSTSDGDKLLAAVTIEDDESTLGWSFSTRSTASVASQSESVFVNNICKAVRSRSPDNSLLPTVQSEDSTDVYLAMNNRDQMSEETTCPGSSSGDVSEKSSDKASETKAFYENMSSEQSRSTGSKFESSDVARVNSSLLLSQMSESSIEVVAQPPPRQTEGENLTNEIPKQRSSTTERDRNESGVNAALQIPQTSESNVEVVVQSASIDIESGVIPLTESFTSTSKEEKKLPFFSLEPELR